MSRETLKDRYEKIIGYIDTEVSGRKKLLNPYLKTLGYYDPRTNTTTDAYFKKVGSGNQLTSLLR